MKRLCFLAVWLFCLCSCLVLQPRRARDLYIRADCADTIKHAELVLDSLAVQKGFDSRHLEANATYILRLMLIRRNQKVHRPEGRLLVRALIKEEEFSRDYRRHNTVTVELSVHAPSGGQTLALALYSENTTETIESYAYLYSVVRRALRPLTR
jgi:hypothetical protein